METVRTMLKPAVVAAVIFGLLFFCYPHSASAASGGVMGGDLFSSSSSSSKDSSSSLSDIDFSYWKSIYSSSSSSESDYSYSPSKEYQRKYSPSKEYRTKYYSSSSLSRGDSYSTSKENQTNTTVPPDNSSGLGIGEFMVIMIIGIIFLIIIYNLIGNCSKAAKASDLSVVKLQVGLLGMARSLQRHLNQIALTTDTSTPMGLSYILKETTRGLLQHEDCCSISSYSSADVKRSIKDCKQCFDLLSFQEHAKFDEETLVNVNNIVSGSTRSLRTTNLSSNEYIVITILVAAKGVLKLPAINSSADLKVALQKLHSIPSQKLMAVKVLWTPQVETDTLSDWELLENYPLLKTLRG